MVKWIKLEKFRCPACQDSNEISWVCAKDNDPVWLSELGIIQCEKGTHKGEVINWRWRCKSKRHNGEFLSADFEGFSFALSQAVQMMTRGGPEWVSALVLNLGKQYKVIEMTKYESITDGSSKD